MKTDQEAGLLEGTAEEGPPVAAEAEAGAPLEDIQQGAAAVAASSPELLPLLRLQ